MTGPAPDARSGPAARTPSVLCRQLTKTFTNGGVNVQALRGIDLEIHPGELTLLVGPSGCGKTTLLSCIAGILNPTSGELRVLGEDLSRLTVAAKARFRSRNLGFVFQQFNLLPSLTAAENAAVPLMVAGVRRQPAIDRARQVLATLGMGERMEAYPAMLSGGQQQRVAIARAMVTEPPLIVCDEPTSALDATTGHTIMRLLRELALRPGRSVIVVTHDPRVFEFGDTIATMEDGRVLHVTSQTAADRTHHGVEELSSISGTHPPVPPRTPPASAS